MSPGSQYERCPLGPRSVPAARTLFLLAPEGAWREKASPWRPQSCSRFGDLSSLAGFQEPSGRQVCGARLPYIRSQIYKQTNDKAAPKHAFPSQSKGARSLRIPWPNSTSLPCSPPEGIYFLAPLDPDLRTNGSSVPATGMWRGGGQPRGKGRVQGWDGR